MALSSSLCHVLCVGRVVRPFLSDCCRVARHSVSNFMLRTIKIATVLIALPLGMYLAASPFVRYAWDDFCTAAIVHRYGFWAAQQYWYTQWSGRFSFTAVVSLIDLPGSWTASVMPILVIAAW